MSLKIIKAGILDSVQDMGRYGFQHLGINLSGAMDRFNLQVANILVDNDPIEAVIEMHFPASVFLFTKPALIALSGADFSASINGEPVPNLRCIAVSKNSVLQFHQLKKGARAYLSLKGGFELEKWMNSYSTHLKAKKGGYKGRMLQKDDELISRRQVDLSILLKENEFLVFPWQADEMWDDENNEIFILPGNKWDSLNDETKENFEMTSFMITNQSDRMGYRLNHHPLQTVSNEEMVSAAVNFGTIQLLPDGRMIILMADHQTTGGYPCIAHVISAHHSRLGQMKAGDKIHFRITNQQVAEDLMMKQHRHLLQLQNACKLKLGQLLKS